MSGTVPILSSYLSVGSFSASDLFTESPTFDFTNIVTPTRLAGNQEVGGEDGGGEEGGGRGGREEKGGGAEEEGEKEKEVTDIVHKNDGPPDHQSSSGCFRMGMSPLVQFGALQRQKQRKFVFFATISVQVTHL